LGEVVSVDDDRLICVVLLVVGMVFMLSVVIGGVLDDIVLRRYGVGLASSVCIIVVVRLVCDLVNQCRLGTSICVLVVMYDRCRGV